MLIAGIVPGIVLTGMFLAYVLFRVWMNPSSRPDVEADRSDRKVGGSALMAISEWCRRCSSSSW